MRRSQFAGDPARGVRMERIARQRFSLNMTAFAAFEGAEFKARRPGCNGSRYHPRLAFRASRTVDRQEFRVGLYERHVQKISATLVFRLFGSQHRNKIEVSAASGS